jgi:hypothetical protein
VEWLRRGVPPEMLVILAAGPFYPVVLAHIDWPDDPVRLHSGVVTLEWDDEDWHGIGALGQIDAPEESVGLTQFGMALTLHGLPADIWGRADDLIRNRAVRLWVGCTTAPGGNVLAAPPFLAQQQFGDGFEITESVGDLAGVLSTAWGPSARSVLAAVHSYEDQIARFPGDTAGRHLIFAEAEAGKLTWPETTS